MEPPSKEDAVTVKVNDIHRFEGISSSIDAYFSATRNADNIHLVFSFVFCGSHHLPLQFDAYLYPQKKPSLFITELDKWEIAPPHGNGIRYGSPYQWTLFSILDTVLMVCYDHKYLAASRPSDVTCDQIVNTLSVWMRHGPRPYLMKTANAEFQKGNPVWQYLGFDRDETNEQAAYYAHNDPQ